MKTRLLFVIPALRAGGAERVLVTLVNNLDRRRFEVALAVFNRTGDLLDDVASDVPIVDLGKRSALDFFSLIVRLRREIRRLRPDAVVSLLLYTNIVTVAACRLLRRAPRTVICEHSNHRSYLRHERFRSVKRRLMRYAYRRAHRIVAISSKMKADIVEDYGVVPEKISLIYNPIPLESIKEKSRQAIGDDRCAMRPEKTLIAAGRLSIPKRFDRLLRVFAEIRKTHDVDLVIIGQGDLLGELQAVAGDLGISDNVRFPGYQSNPFAWLARADVYVLSSDFEGFPMAILEAMTCGLPVAALDCPTGPGEIIQNGVNGLLVPQRDEAALAAAVITLLDDATLRKRLSEAGRLRAEDFGLGNIMPLYERAFLD